MKGDSSTECWSNVGSEWIEKAQTNDFRMHYIMPYTLQKLGNVEGLDILDLGCGEGGYSRELAGRGAKVTAADCSEMSIGYAAYAAKKRIWTYHALSETAMIYMEYKMIPSMLYCVQ